MSDAQHILTLSCPDRRGIVADVARTLSDHGGNILDSQQFNDTETHRFFMRVLFELSDSTAMEKMAKQLRATFGGPQDDCHVRPAKARKRVLILVSAFDHCLVDLMYRHRTGELPMDIVGIVSNHPKEMHAASLLDGVDFHHLPVTPQTRGLQEQALRDLIADTAVDLVVLARYMQILSDDLAHHLAGRCINIHHSFLPGFKGAKPYHQAHARGVKMIGATAHYVTADLDEGPIIHQDVEHISHADTPDDLIRKGRDIERRVLAQAVRAHLEDRVFLNGARTVVMPG